MIGTFLRRSADPGKVPRVSRTASAAQCSAASLSGGIHFQLQYPDVWQRAVLLRQAYRGHQPVSSTQEGSNRSTRQQRLFITTLAAMTDASGISQHAGSNIV